MTSNAIVDGYSELYKRGCSHENGITITAQRVHGHNLMGLVDVNDGCDRYTLYIYLAKLHRCSVHKNGHLLKTITNSNAIGQLRHVSRMVYIINLFEKK